MKGGHTISRASTVASSSGSGGSHVGAGTPGGPSVWSPSRIELKGWRVWSRIRETGTWVINADTLKTMAPSVDCSEVQARFIDA